MTVQDLQTSFDTNNVPKDYYSFRGMAAGDCYVLENTDGTWVTYYSERGSRYDEAAYNNEDEACKAMFTLVARMVLGSQHRQIVY